MDVRILLLCVLALLVNLYGLHGQISSNIELGSSITAGSNDSWHSASGDYAFGFYPVSGGLYLAGIWFDKIPAKTLVWTANRDSPAEARSTVQLTDAGHLLLNYFNAQDCTQRSWSDGAQTCHSPLASPENLPGKEHDESPSCMYHNTMSLGMANAPGRAGYPVLP
ncbi:hypothetical protein Dsin_029594 [Dipteronia sinensis]|uniref:Bulb-type lectin domain-containing protein n=1 Tax=Dipteronia sinensis TaxID=43782 RepID=A0AAD9ZSK9_9ROSI|nr:hypothetical protein Dsin_029594 [Dipteronia sinensis]